MAKMESKMAKLGYKMFRFGEQNSQVRDSK